MQVRPTPAFCSGLRKVAASTSVLHLALCLLLATLTAPTVVGQNASVSISISPELLALTPGQQKQFVAFVSGTSNSAVTWKATAGSVSAEGVFTAPATSGRMVVMVSATSAADPSRTATATVTVAPAAVNPSPVLADSASSCGPPAYSCSRSDNAILVASAPPQLGSDPRFYGGHKGVNTVAVDPDYGNRILRVTDGLIYSKRPAISFNTPASAEKNITSYDESLFIVHAEGSQLCLFQFDSQKFQSNFIGCYQGIGGGGGAEFGYTSADNNAIYNWVGAKLYRFVIDRATWRISADPTFNGGKGYFDADSSQCLNGQVAANHWSVHDRAISSDDQTVIAAIGAGQDKDEYYVAWNAAKGCQWLDVTKWQVSRGWNTGMSSPVSISWKSGLAHPYGSTGGAHNAQIDRSGIYGVLTVNRVKIGHKLFWTIGSNQVDDTCTGCASHWACDFGTCFWNHQVGTGYAMSSAPIGGSQMTLNMNNLAAMGNFPAGEHASHANASSGSKTPYLVSWDTHLSGITQVWQNELTGVNWDGSQRTVRFNKVWNGGASGFWSTSRCPISRQGSYALCGSDYQLMNLDKGFGNGLNQDTCDHKRNAGMRGTNSCRTDVLLFELK